MISVSAGDSFKVGSSNLDNLIGFFLNLPPDSTPSAAVDGVGMAAAGHFLSISNRHDDFPGPKICVRILGR
jgi:hypothetical protein